MNHDTKVILAFIIIMIAGAATMYLILRQLSVTFSNSNQEEQRRNLPSHAGVLQKSRTDQAKLTPLAKLVGMSVYEAYESGFRDGYFAPRGQSEAAFKEWFRGYIRAEHGAAWPL
jgi:hypothetical protein